LISQTRRRVRHLGNPNLYKYCVPCPCTYLRVLGLPITILTAQSTTSGTPLVVLLVQNTDTARARNGALWASLRCAGDPPAKHRRATTVSGACAAVPARTHLGPCDRSQTVLIRSGGYPLVRSTVDPCTGCTARSTAPSVVGSRIHGSAEPLFFKSPWIFIDLHAGPSTY
jgi:hypothetical protein